MAYTLRQATEEDYEFCYNLTRQNMYELFCRHWGGWIDSEFRKGFVPDNIQIILGSDKLIGYFCHEVNEASVYIDNLQISPEFQGRGIGTEILQDFLSMHQDASIRLTTFQDNPAKRLYERLEFKVYEESGPTIKMEKQPRKPCTG